MNITTIAEAEVAYNGAVDRLEELHKRFKNLPDSVAEDSSEYKEIRADIDDAVLACDLLERRVEIARSASRARAKYRSVPLSEGGVVRMSVNEPDRYERGGRSFLTDMFASQIRGDVTATQRLTDHQQYEMEKRDMQSGTFGGLIPPQYLLDLYAKAKRSGRKFADQCDQQELPPTGMSLIIPRLTTGTAGAIQAAENTTVATQDMVESDLTVNVRTVAGYVPVSRQAIERAQYNEQILFEDLTARNWAALDTGCLNGLGTFGTILGLNQTPSIEVVSLPAWSIADLWGALADAQQRIATNVGGLGYEADKCFMHPRRWGAVASALDQNDRPLLLPMTGSGVGFNTLGSGSAAGYGPVGELFGLQVFTDANIPTTEGISDTEDIIVVMASPVVHLWERPDDPVTLAFEQQAGTELALRLVCYSYVAFTAGRYPGASAVITGAGLTPPSYGVQAT